MCCLFAEATNGRFNGEGSGPIFLDGTNCTGKESNVQQCASTAATGRCSHNEDVGVSCQGM